MKLLLKLLINTIAILGAAYLLNGVIVNDFATAIIVAVVLGLLNTFIKPILVILTLPATILTLGLFLLVINAFIVLITGNLVDGFTVNSMFSAILFSFLVSIFGAILTELID